VTNPSLALTDMGPSFRASILRYDASPTQRRTHVRWRRSRQISAEPNTLAAGAAGAYIALPMEGGSSWT
jgi:hypothetical protein